MFAFKRKAPKNSYHKEFLKISFLMNSSEYYSLKQQILTIVREKSLIKLSSGYFLSPATKKLFYFQTFL